MTYTLEKAEDLIRVLQALPPLDASKQKLTKQAVVKHLAAEIAALQQRGYALEQIVESLRGGAFEISTATLKSYLQRTKRKPARATPRKKSTASPTPGGMQQTQAPSVPMTESKSDGAAARSGKQAFLVKDKDSY
jgi:hypothetical protein